MPSHLLCIFDASDSARPAIIAPIDLDAFEAAFHYSSLQRPVRPITPTPGKPLGVPYVNSKYGGFFVTLPCLIMSVPSAESVPLLLLFTLWDHLPSPQPPSRTPSPSPPASFYSAKALPGSVPNTPPPTPASMASFQSSIANATLKPAKEEEDPVVSVGLLVTYLLPIEIIEEYPSYPAMAEKMARAYDDDTVTAWKVRTGDFWKTTLALSPKSQKIIDLALIPAVTSSDAWKFRMMWKRMREEAQAQTAAATSRLLW